jgi:hypothetical protein
MRRRCLPRSYSHSWAPTLWLRTARAFDSGISPCTRSQSFQMSPAAKDSWGPDQCKNDRDGTVDHDERLRITGIEPGHYDVNLADRIGRVCIVRNVEVNEGAVFSIEEKQLTDCRR